MFRDFDAVIDHTKSYLISGSYLYHWHLDLRLAYLMLQYLVLLISVFLLARHRRKLHLARCR